MRHSLCLLLASFILIARLAETRECECALSDDELYVHWSYFDEEAVHSRKNYAFPTLFPSNGDTPPGHHYEKPVFYLNETQEERAQRCAQFDSLYDVYARIGRAERTLKALRQEADETRKGLCFRDVVEA